VDLSLGINLGGTILGGTILGGFKLGLLILRI
jgi:hypothetical protein